MDFQDNLFFFHRDVCPDDRAVHNPSHFHNLYELYLITEGSCDYFIANRAYHLSAGDLVLIPAGVIHNTVYCDTGHSRLLINCHRRYIPLAAQPDWYLYRNAENQKEVRRIFEAIEREWQKQDPFSEDAIGCLMRLLFYVLARNPNQYPAEEQGKRTVTRAVRYIQQHFTDDIGLEEVAKEVSVSREHFSRLFKKETGFGFREYLNLLRLQKAEHLLRSADGKTVSEIAAACGFADSNYFSVCFKKCYGISPKKYARKPCLLK